MEHKAPWECTYAKEDKSKCKPGIPPKSDQKYFEILSLCVLQAGLGWKMVRQNWARFKHGFYDFNIAKLAGMRSSDLIKESDVIRNRKKVQAIIHNARELQKISKEYSSFSNFLKSLKKMNDKEVFKVLMKRFKHVGKYTAEYYLHSVGYWK